MLIEIAINIGLSWNSIQNNNIDYIYNHKKWVQENQRVSELVENSKPQEDYKGTSL